MHKSFPSFSTCWCRIFAIYGVLSCIQDQIRHLTPLIFSLQKLQKYESVRVYGKLTSGRYCPQIGFIPSGSFLVVINYFKILLFIFFLNFVSPMKWFCFSVSGFFFYDLIWRYQMCVHLVVAPNFGGSSAALIVYGLLCVEIGGHS